MVSRYSRRPFIKTTGTALEEKNFFVLGGLNLYTPDELSKDNDSPYARNFRIFQSDDLEARVSVSKRKGHTFYTVPVGETNRGEITSTTGASDKTIASITWLAQVFTVSAAGRLTKVELNLKNDNAGTGPLLVDIYSEVDSAPGVKLASTSIAPTSIAATYGYVSARFIEAPQVATSTNYYIVVHQQSEGTGDYKWSGNTSATTAKTSSDSGNTWATTTYAHNYKVYVSTDAPVKAFVRYYRSDTTPVTLLFVGTTMYEVNDATGALTSKSTAFSASAVDYRFVTVQDVLYIVNGVDAPKTWNGTTLADLGGSPEVSIDIAFHKDRLFLLNADSKIQYSEPGDYDNFDVVAFVYAFPPKSAETAIRMIPYQDNIVAFSKNAKAVISGSDVSTMVRRESTAVKGLASQNGLWKDTNYLYFVSNDDIYMFNGGTDTGLGIKIDRIFDDMATAMTTKLIVHDDILRMYFSPSGSGFNSSCLLYDMGYKQWMLDTEVYVGQVGIFNGQTDDNKLVEASSLAGVLYYGETGNSDLGKPILFDYYTKYFSFDAPAHKHRIKRLYTFFRPGDGPYYITVGVDANENDSPSETQVYLGTDSSTWGGGDTWGSTAVWGGTVIEPTRISVPGQARKHQVRFTQHGVDNPVEILGFTVMYSIRRPI